MGGERLLMTRRHFGAAALGGASFGRLPAFQATPPKNILWIMTDQHRAGALGSSGDPVAKTPALDSLARSGTSFDNAYCTNPVCAPSRASLLTGLYTHHHEAWNNATPMPFHVRTIAHYLGRAGYMSALIGKMHFVDAQTHGFDFRLDFNDWLQYLGPKTQLFADEVGKPNSGSGLPEIDALWRDFGDPWAGHRERDGRLGLVPVGRVSKLAEQDHFESFVTRESVRFLKNHARKQPFLLIASYLKPHDPFMPAERFARMFSKNDMKVPPTWGKTDLSSVPAEIRNSIEKDWITPELLNSPENVKQRIAYYYANLAQADAAIGELLRALEDQGLARDTIVMYTSDHGEMLGDHGLWQKMVFYEPAVRVPLIFRVPGLTRPDTRNRTLVSLASVLPTLLELCRVPDGEFDEGSLVGDLQEPAKERAATVYSEYALRTPRAKYMIREKQFKYCFYVNDTPELYNLETDPDEMRNLAASPASQETVERMRERLFAWRRPPEIGMPPAARPR